MRYSLLSLVLLATISLGLVMDRLFTQLQNDDADGLDWYRQLGTTAVRFIDHDRAEDVSLGVPSDARFEASGQVSTEPATGAPMRVLDAAAFALPSALENRLVAGEALALDSESGVTLYFDLPVSDQVLALSPPDTAAGEVGLRLALTVLFYGVLASLILMWLLPLVRRLHALSTTARAFGQGALERRVRTSSRSYLHDIEFEFNRMADRIQHLVEDNRLLSDAVSHDLRTPLARLRFGVDALAEEPPKALRDNYLDWLGSDVDHMERLVDVLLEFARLDGRLERHSLSDLVLEPLISDVVSHTLTTSDHLIRWRGGSEHVVRGHTPHVRMLLANLLQNAVNHTDTCVDVSLEKRRGRVVLTVEDDGPGIAREDRDRVIKPFERGRKHVRDSHELPELQQERPTHTMAHGQGHGLGLAIVRRVAEWHGATLSIDDSPTLGGARVEVGFLPG